MPAKKKPKPVVAWAIVGRRCGKILCVVLGPRPLRSELFSTERAVRVRIVPAPAKAKGKR